jgi:ATP-binding protein involved in chromosome partitioning
MEIRETSDSGAPVVVSQPDSAYATAYRTIAARIWDQLQTSHVGAPAIVVE